MPRFFLLLAFVLGPPAFAQSSIPTGTWTGSLTPQNHPDLHIPMTYSVEECAEGLKITLTSGQGNAGAVQARNVRVSAERVRFVFDEPEAEVPLTCRLERQRDGSFAGRCTADDGKYATFVMRPPAQSTIGCSE